MDIKTLGFQDNKTELHIENIRSIRLPIVSQRGGPLSFKRITIHNLILS